MKVEYAVGLRDGLLYCIRAHNLIILVVQIHQCFTIFLNCLLLVKRNLNDLDLLTTGLSNTLHTSKSQYSLVLTDNHKVNNVDIQSH